MSAGHGVRGRADAIGRLLALDTATSRACLAVGDGHGRLIAERGWRAGLGPSETILGQLEGLLAEVGCEPAALGGIIVGVGPGAFTGLRVGLATAKTLAHELGRPMVGIETTAALALAAWWRSTSSGPTEPPPPAAAASQPRRITVVMPAGPGARYLARYGVGEARRPAATPSVSALEAPRLLRPAEIDEGEADLVAVDLDSAAADSAAAGERGAAALDGLAAALLSLGAARLASGATDDVAALVPTYVSLPRGAPAEGVAWSPDLR